MNQKAIAYLLIGVMVLALAAIVAWRVYHSRDRMVGRQRRREKAHRESRGAGHRDG